MILKLKFILYYYFFAGTFVKEGCSMAFERGVCQQCDFDTYTEHDNGLEKCLKCTKCRLGTRLRAVQSVCLYIYIYICVHLPDALI